RRVGNNLLGYCAKCPPGQHPNSPRLSPSPPPTTGTPDVTLLPAGSSVPGGSGLLSNCGGCSGPFNQFYLVNVRTSLAFEEADLKKQRDKYSLEYDCVPCKGK